MKKPKKRRTKSRNSRGFLSGLDVEILFCVAMGAKTNKQLHAKLKKRNQKNVPKSTISDHTTKLQRLGLITSRRAFNLKELYLTDHGKLTISTIMSRGEGLSLGLPVRGHAFSFVTQILREPRGLRGRLQKENWVAFYPKNRVAYKQRRMGVMVIFNPRSVQFMAPPVYAPSQNAAFEEALRLVLKVKDFLEQEEFKGLVLGSPEQVVRVAGQHYARPFDPLAVEYYKNSLETGVRSTYRSDRLAIDVSLGLPETETVHKVFAKDDLAKITEFYERLIRSELTFEDLETLKSQLPKHFGQVMQRLDGLEKGQLTQDKLLTHLAGSTVMLTGNVEKLVEALSPAKPQTRRGKTKKKSKVLPRSKADEKIEEIRRKVEKALAKLERDSL